MCVLPDSIGMESDEIFLMKVHLQQQTLHINQTPGALNKQYSTAAAAAKLRQLCLTL